MKAASRLLAAVIAQVAGEVSGRSSSGIRPSGVPGAGRATLDAEDGPSDAWRRQSATDSPILPKPCVSETDVVVLPSPALVGVTAVTQMILPSDEPQAIEHAQVDLGLVLLPGKLLDLVVQQACSRPPRRWAEGRLPGRFRGCSSTSHSGSRGSLHERPAEDARSAWRGKPAATARRHGHRRGDGRCAKCT